MCLTSPKNHPKSSQKVRKVKSLKLVDAFWGKVLSIEKLPLKQEQVRALMLKYGNSDLPDLQIVTLITLGFVGFFRWDDLSQLKFSDLFFYPDHLAVFLEKRKNDQLCEGSWVYMQLHIDFPLIQAHTAFSAGWQTFRRLIHF